MGEVREGVGGGDESEDRERIGRRGERGCVRESVCVRERERESVYERERV